MSRPQRFTLRLLSLTALLLANDLPAQETSTPDSSKLADMCRAEWIEIAGRPTFGRNGWQFLIDADADYPPAEWQLRKGSILNRSRGLRVGCSNAFLEAFLRHPVGGSIDDRTKVKFRFDQAEPKTVWCERSANGSGVRLPRDHVDWFVEELLNSRTLRVWVNSSPRGLPPLVFCLRGTKEVIVPLLAGCPGNESAPASG